MKSEYEEVIRQQRVALEHCKLDLQDRLNARRHKDKRRKELADGLLRHVINSLQLAGEDARMAGSPSSAAHHRLFAGPSLPEAQPGRLSATQMDKKETRTRGEGEEVPGAAAARSGGVSQSRERASCSLRRHQATTIYSDAEIRSMLRCAD